MTRRQASQIAALERAYADLEDALLRAELRERRSAERQTLPPGEIKSVTVIDEKALGPTERSPAASPSPACCREFFAPRLRTLQGLLPHVRAARRREVRRRPLIAADLGRLELEIVATSTAFKEMR